MARPAAAKSSAAVNAATPASQTWQRGVWRQPLHALSLLLSTLQERTREPEASALLAKIATSADSLDTLFKGLLDLSRLDAGSVTPEYKPVALGALLLRLENDFRPLAQAKGLAFACAASNACSL